MHRASHQKSRYDGNDDSVLAEMSFPMGLDSHLRFNTNKKLKKVSTLCDPEHHPQMDACSASEISHI